MHLDCGKQVGVFNVYCISVQNFHYVRCREIWDQTCASKAAQVTGSFY